MSGGGGGRRGGDKHQLMPTTDLRKFSEPAVCVADVAKQHEVSLLCHNGVSI